MISDNLLFLVNLSKAQAIISRRFDSLSAHGIGFSDFIILYLLDQATGHKMRRIDLAEKTGLTPSGVTRLLAPLEKIGLVAREINERDARVSYVVITPTGKKIFEDARVTAESVSDTIIRKNRSLRPMIELLNELNGNNQ